MNSLRAIYKVDYRILAIIIVIISSSVAVLSERVLYNLSPEQIHETVISYWDIYLSDTIVISEYFWYLLKSELKKFSVLYVLNFTCYGIWCNVIVFVLSIYRSVFFIVSMHRELSKGWMFYVCTGICFLYHIPVYLYYLNCSGKSMIYCVKNNVKLCHCSKYQLQTELKMVIILMLYIILGVVLETVLGFRYCVWCLP